MILDREHSVYFGGMCPFSRAGSVEQRLEKRAVLQDVAEITKINSTCLEPRVHCVLECVCVSLSVLYSYKIFCEKN